MNNTEKLPGTKAVAQRMANAENNFVATVVDFAGCTKPEAEKVLRVYRKLKLVKMDAVGGKISVTHGIYLDQNSLQKAIEFAE